MFVHGFTKGCNSNWLPGTLIGTSGEQLYKVKLSDGRIVQRHADHVCSRQAECNIPVQDDEFDDIPNPTTQKQNSSGNVATEVCRSQRNCRPLNVSRLKEGGM